MINPETGEIDEALIHERASLRAAHDFGSPSFPPATYRSELQWCRDRAANEHLDWRRRHGLPDDTVTTMVMVPSWGCSGDSFGRG